MMCIDICVLMIVMYMSTTDARGALLTQRKKNQEEEWGGCVDLYFEAEGMAG